MTRKVLHVIPYMAEAAGGPPVVVRRLVEGAAKAGWIAEVLTSPDYAEDGGKQLQGEAGITVLQSQISSLFGEGKAKLEEAIRGADIVHCHTIWSPLVTKAAALSRRLDKPYVVSPHGMLDPYSFGQKNLKKRVYLEAIERRTIAGASSVMFTTSSERDLATESFGRIPNAAVIPLGADPLPEDKASLRVRFFDDHPDLRDRPLLLFLGRIHPKKRPEVLLDLMKELHTAFPSAMLIYVGSGEDAHVAQLKQRINELGVGEQVRLLGHLAGLSKFAALAASDIFLLPSQQENFAIAAAEALHAGCPVILTRSVNIWSEIVEGNAGIAIGEECLHGGLVHSVSALLNDPELLKNMSGNASRLAQERYVWANSSMLTYSAYEDSLG